ncbi:MAG: phosphoglycerate dehydrogenase [Proteobacteria bacterium]|nr:phosphoglycerate dehydrogenase [Pseudomonadota bacterium]
MAQNNIFIFDFDSTFIQVEAMDILAQIALHNHPQKEERLKMIREITELAMEGRYSFQESLSERFSLLYLTQAHLSQALEIIKQKITPSFERNKTFFKQYADSIYIVSSTFIEIIWPCVQSFGIKRSHIFANKLLYDFENNILGYDTQNPLAQDQGKVKLLQQCHFQGNIIVIGDGYTDYEIKALGIADTFVAFTENVSRKTVVDQADIIVNELEGLFLTCQIPYINKNTHKKVLLLENIHPFVAHFFNQRGYEVQSFSNALDHQALINNLKDIHILGIRSKTEINADLIEMCPNLEAIGAFCIGTNQIDLKMCSEKGIAVFNAPYSNTRSVVELALGEIILLLRRAVDMNHKLHRGIWEKASNGAHEVRGKTLGIIGYGNIGSQLSILAEALGMYVLYYDIEDKLPLGNAKVCHSLENLLNLSDVVSIHIDGREENKNFISTKEFLMMKDGVVFLNLSRGFVVDDSALMNALCSGKISGVGLDVYPTEPHGSKCEFKTPFQTFENAFITPHIGGNTEEAQQNIGEYVSRNLHAYLGEGTSIGSVNFPQLFLPSLNYPQRIIHIHKNVPGILAQINSLFAQFGANIEGQFLKTNENMGYVITDLNHEIDQSMVEKLKEIDHTLKVKTLTCNKCN